jgi:hypothetical protein
MLITRPNTYPIPMPSGEEMAGLLRISRSRIWPKAPPLNGDQQKFFTGFVAAFSFVATLRRCAELSRVDSWIDHCSRWAEERYGEYVDIGGPSPFLCACASAGDIDFDLGTTWPHGIRVGLTYDSSARAATDGGWQRVLSTRKTREPTQPPKTTPHATPIPTIQQLNMLLGPMARPFE